MHIVREVALADKHMWMPLAKTEGGTGVVFASGAVVEAEHITYFAETAQLFEQVDSYTQPSANGPAALLNRDD
jgi:hypothetical protein